MHNYENALLLSLISHFLQLKIAHITTDIIYLDPRPIHQVIPKRFRSLSSPLGHRRSHITSVIVILTVVWHYYSGKRTLLQRKGFNYCIVRVFRYNILYLKSDSRKKCRCPKHWPSTIGVPHIVITFVFYRHGAITGHYPRSTFLQ